MSLTPIFRSMENSIIFFKPSTFLTDNFGKITLCGQNFELPSLLESGQKQTSKFGSKILNVLNLYVILLDQKIAKIMICQFLYLSELR